MLSLTIHINTERFLAPFPPIYLRVSPAYCLPPAAFPRDFYQSLATSSRRLILHHLTWVTFGSHEKSSCLALCEQYPRPRTSQGMKLWETSPVVTLLHPLEIFSHHSPLSKMKAFGQIAFHVYDGEI